MDSRSIEELSLNDILENTVKSYDKVLSSHEEILTAKAQLMENQLILLRKQIHIVTRDLEDIADTLLDTRLFDICRRLRKISVPPAARNTLPSNLSTRPASNQANLSTRPASMIAPSSPRVVADHVRRCSSESQHLSTVKVRKKSITIERLESDRAYRPRNSVCHVSQRDAKLDYQLSSDMLALQESTFAKTYGAEEKVVSAAITIQRSWRKHCLNKTFTRIKLETPYRTKSMTTKTKPSISITRQGSSAEYNTVRQVTGSSSTQHSPPQNTIAFKRNDIARQIIRTKNSRILSASSSEFSFSQQLEFDADSDSSREHVYIVQPGSLLLDKQCSEPADFKVPVVQRRRNTDQFCPPDRSVSLEPQLQNHTAHRPHSNSWSTYQQTSSSGSSNSLTCLSLLGERVSGDGAEYPDQPSYLRQPIESDSTGLSNTGLSNRKHKKYNSPVAEKYGDLWSSTSQDPEQKQLCRNYKLGVYKFNKRPSQGVKHLTSTGVVDSSPYHIAAFLLNGKGLSLSQIGNYITDLRKPKSMAVLEEFMKQIDFTALPFEQALRHFISKLRLPGEAQKIDKLMEAFAERYCECNPKTISETQDTIYVLAFSVIILQTDLHNPQIKLHRKMDLESFIINNKGIDNGNDLPRDLLEAIYEGVKKEPIISGRDHLDFLESIDKSIVGKKINLMDPWRMLMMSTQMHEIINKNEKLLPEKHVRHIFLFNDLLVVTKLLQVRGKATTKTTKERVISTCSFQYRQHYTICAFKAEPFVTQFYPYGVRLVDSYADSKVLLEMSAYSEEDRSAFLTELAEVTWVYRALENDRIGSLGVADKLGQSTLSLHSFNSDTDGGRRHTHTLGRRFFKSNIFKSAKRDALGPSSSLFYTKGISSTDVRTQSDST